MSSAAGANLVIFRAAHPVPSQAQVQGIVLEHSVVGPHIHHYGEDPAWTEACCCHIQIQFSCTSAAVYKMRRCGNTRIQVELLQETSCHWSPSQAREDHANRFTPFTYCISSACAGSDRASYRPHTQPLLMSGPFTFATMPLCCHLKGGNMQAVLI